MQDIRCVKKIFVCFRKKFNPFVIIAKQKNLQKLVWSASATLLQRVEILYEVEFLIFDSVALSQYVFFLNEARTLHYRQGTLLMPASLRCRQPVSIPYLPKAWHMKVYKRNRDARKMNLFYYLVGALNIWFTQPFCEKDSFFEQLFCAFGCPCIIVALYFFN